MTESVVILTPVTPGTVMAPCALGFPRIVSEQAASVACREVNINMNRARLQDMFITGYFKDYEFVLLLDSDVEVSRDTVDMLVKAWKPGTTPCANTKGHVGAHVVASCALIHRKDYMAIDYMEKPYECQCKKVPNPFYVEGAVGRENK